MVTIILSMLPLHPLLRSPKRVLNDTLKLTPMGTHIDNVVGLVDSQTIIDDIVEWREPLIYYDRGYISPGAAVPGWPVSEVGRESIVGYKSVKVSYKTHYNTYISIYWGFDEDGKLIDVYVHKSFDMIQVRGARKTAK